MKFNNEYSIRILSAFTRRLINIRLFPVYVLLIIMNVSCWDSDDKAARFTFQSEMMGEYLDSVGRADLYSEFANILDTTKVMGLLNSYGQYTCFAPTNEAIAKFYKVMNVSSYRELGLDTLKTFVYNHIIKDYVFESEDFVVGRLSALNMANRYISTNPTLDSIGFPIVYVNNKSTIINRDIEVHNGVIHSIDNVIVPTDSTLYERISNDPKFTLFAKALFETDLYKEISLIEDYSYDPDDNDLSPSKENGTLQEIPQFRKYGYTILAESDSLFESEGVSTIEGLQALAEDMYPRATDPDYKSKNNALNQFISYHLINKQISYNKFIKDYDTRHMIKTVDMYEYIEPMLENSLIEVKVDRASGEYNLFNDVDGEAIRINKNNYDNDAVNGVYHEIDKLLVFTDAVTGMIWSKRLRLDIASFFPEVTNNNMRGTGVVQVFIFPKGYIENVDYSDNTKLRYLSQDDRYEDFQGDEFIFGNNTKSDVLYELTLYTIPIPAGTYEIRMGYQPIGRRGVAQIYWDGVPTGIPVDFTLNADNPIIGYERPGDSSDDPNGFENDKMMRNRNFMKGPASYKVVDGAYYSTNNPSARYSNKSLRKILGKFTFSETEKHSITFKAVKVGEFMVDYIEIVPIEVLENEDIY